MKNVLFIFLIYCFSLSFFSCSSSTTDNSTTDNETTNNELIGNNNNSILSGSIIGSGEYNNSDLSKSVRILVGNSGGFSYKTPYVGRGRLIESFYWIIPITNWSKDPKCWISMESIKFYDSSNNILHTYDYSFVSGSIGLISNSYFINSCLTYREEGYVSGIVTKNLYTKVYKIVVSEIVSRSSESIKLSDPSIKVKPLRYSTSGTYKRPTITVKNYSEIDIVPSSSKYFLLDSNNRPIYWGFLYPEKSGSFSSNSSKRFVTSSGGFYYSGSRFKIHVFINVTTFNQTSSSPVSNSH